MRLLSLILIPLLLASAGGCAAIEDALGGMDKPTARIVGVDFAGLDANSVTLDFAVKVSNPYEVDLPVMVLTESDYASLASGQTVSIAADGRVEVL